MFQYDTIQNLTIFRQFFANYFYKNHVIKSHDNRFQQISRTHNKACLT